MSISKKALVSLLLVMFVLSSVLTGCGQKAPAAAPTPAPAKVETTPAPSTKKLKVGYVVNFMSHQWYQNICNGAKARAAEVGVDLLIADANQDSNAQISAAENMITQKVDILVLTPVDAKALAPIVKKAKDAGIPVITESNKVDGAVSFVGIDNKAGGKKAGLWLVDYVKANKIDPKILIVGLPNFDDCRNRVDGFKEALKESGIKYEIKQEVDGQGMKEKALTVSQDALTAHPDVNVIYGINDDSTTGGMAAYKAAGLDEKKLTAIGFGFEGSVGQSALLSGGPYKASLAMFPNYVGVSLIDAAVSLSKGEKLPDHYQTPTVVITKDNFDKFYSKDGTGYKMSFDAIRAESKK